MHSHEGFTLLVAEGPGVQLLHRHTGPTLLGVSAVAEGLVIAVAAKAKKTKPFPIRNTKSVPIRKKSVSI